MIPASGNLSPDELHKAVAAGEIDTVIVAFTDMQGRLVGKRVSARLFLEDTMHHGAECCNYLLAVDVELNTVDGYALTSWESGSTTSRALRPLSPGTHSSRPGRAGPAARGETLPLSSSATQVRPVASATSSRARPSTPRSTGRP